MSRRLAALAAVFASGCYIEARGRGDVLGATSGSTLGGALIEGVVSAGFQLAGTDDRYAAVLGGCAQRQLAASRATMIDHLRGDGIELGLVGPPVDFLPAAARGYELRLGVGGWVPDNGSLSVVRLGAAARFGIRHVELVAGPSVSWWDAARGGTAVGAGVEAGLRLYLDPREGFAR